MNLMLFEKTTCPESLSPPTLAEIPKQVGGGLPGIWLPAGLGQKQAQRPFGWGGFAVCEQKTAVRTVRKEMSCQTKECLESWVSD